MLPSCALVSAGRAQRRFTAQPLRVESFVGSSLLLPFSVWNNQSEINIMSVLGLRADRFLLKTCTNVPKTTWAGLLKSGLEWTCTGAALVLQFEMHSLVCRLQQCSKMWEWNQTKSFCSPHLTDTADVPLSKTHRSFGGASQHSVGVVG